MDRPTKIAVTLGSALVLLVVLVVALAQGDADDGPEAVDTTTEEFSTLVRDDSRVLGKEGESGVTFVEFLDFECEACRAAYPIVEQLREQYAGRVTFVLRYFPLPGHANSVPAARAVESAARQGQLEEMYQRMYETQAEWGEQRESQAALFRTFADELGLDLAQYDADVASEEVAARVQRDVDDGIALGVSGTPTFYLDGRPFQPRTVDDFATAIDAALE